MTAFTHRIYSPGRQRVYWKGHVAADADTATHAVVQVGEGVYHQTIEFAWPAEKHQLENLEEMLDKMFEAGGLAAKAEIRKVLGVTDPRR